MHAFYTRESGRGLGTWQRCRRGCAAVALVGLSVGCDVYGSPPSLHLDVRILALLLVILVVVVFGWRSGVRWDRERRRVVSTVGSRMGFEFQPRGSVPSDLGRLRMFRRGPRGKVTNVLHAHRGTADVMFFDFSWGSAGSGEGGGQIFSQTVAAFHTAGGALPNFALEPGGLLSRLPGWAAHILGHMVTFDSNPAFSRHYTVQTLDRNEAAVQKALTPPFQSILTSVDTDHQWSVEGAGAWFVIYRFDHLAKLEDYPDFITRALAAAQALSGA